MIVLINVNSTISKPKADTGGGVSFVYITADSAGFTVDTTTLFTVDTTNTTK